MRKFNRIQTKTETFFMVLSGILYNLYIRQLSIKKKLFM